MNKKPNTRFYTWFKKQFPISEPHLGKCNEYQCLIDKHKHELMYAELLLENAEHANIVKDAALKGWVAGYAAGKLEGAKKK